MALDHLGTSTRLDTLGLDLSPTTEFFISHNSRLMYGFKKRSYKGYKKTSAYRGSAPQYRPYSRGGYGRRFKRPAMGSIARRRLNTHYQRGSRSKVVGKYRSKRNSFSLLPSRKGIARAAALALATTGNFTLAGLTSRLTCATGEQLWMSAQCNPFIQDQSTLTAVIATNLARALTLPDTASITQYNQKFWIRRATMKLHITNTSQIDCDIICYPYVTRYDTVSPSGLYPMANVNASETKVGSTTSQQGLLSNETSTVGFTPFMSHWITQQCKLGKPKKVHLQGGQSYTFSLSDNRALYLTYVRLAGAEGVGGFRGHTRGMFMTATGTVVNDTASVDDIDFGFVSLDVQNVTTYEWIQSATPWHFNDVVTNTADIVNIKIIQPQTGVVTTGPVVV